MRLVPFFVAIKMSFLQKWGKSEFRVNLSLCTSFSMRKTRKRELLYCKNSNYKLPFSTIEIDAIRTACKNKKERAIVEFLLASGVRVSELCSIRINDINFDTLSVIVREGKGAKQRKVYINDLASKHLVDYLTTRNVNGDYLFYNKKKEPLKPGGVRHLLKAIEERAGISNVHPHRFRRTFATGMSNRGMDIQEIGKLLGHSNLDTTLTYVYTSEEKIRTSYLKYTA